MNGCSSNWIWREKRNLRRIQRWGLSFLVEACSAIHEGQSVPRILKTVARTAKHVQMVCFGGDTSVLITQLQSLTTSSHISPFSPEKHTHERVVIVVGGFCVALAASQILFEGRHVRLDINHNPRNTTPSPQRFPLILAPEHCPTRHPIRFFLGS